MAKPPPSIHPGVSRDGDTSIHPDSTLPRRPAPPHQREMEHLPRRRPPAVRRRNGLHHRRCGRRRHHQAGAHLRHRVRGQSRPGVRGVLGIRATPLGLADRPGRGAPDHRRQCRHRRGAAGADRTGRHRDHQPTRLSAVLRHDPRGGWPGRRSTPDQRRHRLPPRRRRHRAGIRRRCEGAAAVQPAQSGRPRAHRRRTLPDRRPCRPARRVRDQRRDPRPARPRSGYVHPVPVGE